MKSSLFLALCGLTATFAVPLEKKADYALKDKHFVPAQWRKVKRANCEDTIDLHIAVKHGNFKELERQLLEVSDPTHHLYGNHLSQADVHALIAPSQNAIEAVHDWLEDNGIHPDQLRYTPAKDWVMIELPISKVEDLLDTEYHVYENDAGTTIVRTAEYSLPKSLHEHIDTIQPTNYFSDHKAMADLAIKPERHELSGTDLLSVGVSIGLSIGSEPEEEPPSTSNNASAVCKKLYKSPNCLRTLYNTIDYVPQVPQLNSAGTTNFANESSNHSDFTVYMSQFRKDAGKDYQFNVEIVADGIDMQDREKKYLGVRDYEGNLDVQTIGGIIYPTKFTTYSTGGTPPPFIPDIGHKKDYSIPWLTWLIYVNSAPDVPLTITTSYGVDEQTVPESYAQRVCSEFAALGARGTTVLFSSGDYGLGKNGTCFTNDGTKTPRFLPHFPASCPWVTAVGATMNIEPEEVAFRESNGFSAGGGFSNYFPRPIYQEFAVGEYLATASDLPDPALYNGYGRAYPDISAQGKGFVVVYDGEFDFLDGTSASVPTVAGIITLVNDALLAAGRAPLGFLNPWLYSWGYNGFNDITIGRNWGCNVSGFPAQQGWDLPSGYGTPDFKKIRSVLMV